MSVLISPFGIFSHGQGSFDTLEAAKRARSVF